MATSRGRRIVRPEARHEPELASTADLVYTGRGSLPWMLDLGAWSEPVRELYGIVAHKPAEAELGVVDN